MNQTVFIATHPQDLNAFLVKEALKKKGWSAALVHTSDVLPTRTGGIVAHEMPSKYGLRRERHRTMRCSGLIVGLVLLQALAASCGRRPVEKLAPSQAGTQLELPVNAPFPRPGMQWSYKVIQRGFPAPVVIPASVTYRYLYSDYKKRLWANLFFYDDRPKPSDGTHEVVEPGYVFAHPPRSRDFGFRDLEWAPFPVATPGKPGTQTRKIELGPGWEPHVGEIVESSYTDFGPCLVDVPAGRFENAWCVTGKSQKWAAQFWWVEHVGWVRMAFQCSDGRSLDLQLDQVRLITDFQDS